MHCREDFYLAYGYDVWSTNYPWGPYKVTQHSLPPPSGVFVFIDEHEQSIASGSFLINQPGWVSGGNDLTWLSLPADRHRQGCNLSFLDGHVEHWRWKAPKLYKAFDWPATPGGDVDDPAAFSKSCRTTQYKRKGSMK